MSTAMQVHTPRDAAAAARNHALPLAEREPDYAALMQTAAQLVGSGILPDWIKRPEQAFAIILAGREMGMPPMRALRSLQLVKGKVIESADSQLARFKADGGRAQFTELTDTRAVLHLRHPNGDEHVETFTMEDAERAGLLQAQPNYRKFPRAMLRSRAITAALKSIGWEGGVGAYDPDEARLSFAPELAPAEPAAAAEPEPASVEDNAEMTTAQRQKILTLLDDVRLPEELRTKTVAWLNSGKRISKGKAGVTIGKLTEAINAAPLSAAQPREKKNGGPQAFSAGEIEGLD